MRELPEWIEEKLNTDENIPGISERERKALKMFYYENRNNSQIADALDISEAYVSQFKSRAIKKAEEARKENENDRKEVVAPEDEPDYLGDEHIKDDIEAKTSSSDNTEPNQETVKMLLLLINGDDPIRVHPESDTEKLQEVLENAGIEAEVYERVS